jgi:hypothetical protein
VKDVTKPGLSAVSHEAKDERNEKIDLLNLICEVVCIARASTR